MRSGPLFNPEAPLEGLHDHWQEQPAPRLKWWWWLIVVALCALACWLLTFPVRARDLGQWDNIDPQISAWFSKLMQPDTFPPISCCGEGDAYWADVVEVVDGHMIAVITDDRDDKPLRRIHEEPGTRYMVPPGKITKQDGNPTGHVIIFLGGVSNDIDGRRTEPRQVLCYVQNGGV